MCRFQEEISTRIQEKRALEEREAQQGEPRGRPHGSAGSDASLPGSDSRSEYGGKTVHVGRLDGWTHLPLLPRHFPSSSPLPFNKPTLQPPVFGPSHRIILTLSGALCFDVFKYFHSFDGLLRMLKYDIRKDSFFNCSHLRARRSLSRTLLCCKTSFKSLYEIWRFRYLKSFYAGRGRTNFNQIFRSKVPLRALFESCSAQCCVSVSAASPQPKINPFGISTICEKWSQVILFSSEFYVPSHNPAGTDKRICA